MTYAQQQDLVNRFGEDELIQLTNIDQPESATIDSRRVTQLAWAREHLDQPLTVERMAEQAAMSARHFTRAFIAETGATPAKAVERLRVE